MPRKAPTLPAQALPPEKRKELPPPFEAILPSGLMAKWRMPDPFTIIAFDGVLPDPITAAVIKLLNEERAYTPEDDPRKFRNDAQTVRGMYGIVGAMLEEPLFDPSIEYGENGTLGRREIGLMDVVSLYWRFRISTRQDAPIAAPQSDDTQAPADAPPDGD
jgi:hypothetical protein